MPAAGPVTHLNRISPLSGGTEGLTGIRGSWVSVFSCVNCCLIGGLKMLFNCSAHTAEEQTVDDILTQEEIYELVTALLAVWQMVE